MLCKQKKVLVTLVIALFALSFLGSAGFANAKSATVHVYSGQKIQDAINAAIPGDTIIVHKGTYQEMVGVIKPLTLIGCDAVIQTPDYYGIAISAKATVT